jgi:hypothetical protein
MKEIKRSDVSFMQMMAKDYAGVSLSEEDAKKHIMQIDENCGNADRQSDIWYEASKEYFKN